MAEVISIDIEIEGGESGKTLGGLREDLEKLNNEIEKVDIASDRFQELESEIANTGREVKNLELSFEALDNEQVASELGSVAGAVGDVTASIVLLGGESETLQEIAASIELALGVSIGLKGAIEGISSAQKLWTNLLKTHAVVQKAVTIATKLFKIALITTGIGAIVVGVGLLITNLEGVGNWFKWVGDQIVKFFKPQIDLVIKALQFLGIVESDEEKASRQRSEEKKKRIQEESNVLKAETDKQLKILEDAAGEEQKILDAKIEGLDFEIRKRKAAGIETASIERQKIAALLESAETEIRIEDEKLKLLSESIKKQLALRGFTLEQAQGLATENKALLEQLFGKNAIDALFGESEALDQARSNLKAIAQEKEIFEIEQATKEKERLAKAREERKEIESVQKIEAQEIRDEEVAAEEKKVNAFAIIAQREAARQEQEKEDRLARIAEEEAARQRQLDNVQIGLNVLNSAADAFINNEKTRDKVKKKLAIAQLAIDTARAISAGVASAAAVPFPGNIPAILSTVATVLANVAQAKRLLGSSSGGGASAGGGGLSRAASTASTAGGGVDINAVSNTSTILGDQEVFVTETAISDKQKKVNVIEKSATF